MWRGEQIMTRNFNGLFIALAAALVIAAGAFLMVDALDDSRLAGGNINAATNARLGGV